jgi:cytochrome c
MIRYAMQHMTRGLRSLAAALLLFGATATGAELRGHGGPVRAISVTPEGAVITGSFDTRAIVWSLQTGTAREVLLFHAGQVNAVAALPNGRFATAGADGRIAIWQLGQGTPARVLDGHAGPIAALAVSPDGSTLASASWDTTVRLWPLSGGEPRVLEGHSGGVNAVAFLADGTPVSAGYDANLMIWPREAPPVTVAFPTPLNTLATLPGDRLGVGAADGKLRVIDRSGDIRSEVQIAPTPVIALAVSPDGKYLAAASLEGNVAVLDAASLAPVNDLIGAGLPVWSLAFAPDGQTLLTGGADRVVHEWNVETGEPPGALATGPTDPLAEFAGNPDAEAFRACIACHTLDPEDGNRAGPTLHGIFGRRIASLPDFRYSPALRELDIVWTPETVSRLFELGPASYTPGSRMPEQTIGDAEGRAALIRFLQTAAAAD